MYKRHYFLVLAFLMFTMFSGIVLADNEEGKDSGETKETKETEETENTAAIDLMKVRDTTLKSFSILKSFSSLVSVDAEIRGDDLVLFVKDYVGVVDVDVTDVSGSGSVGEALFVHGSDYFVIDLSSLSTGAYEIELDMEAVRFIGQFSIN